MPRYRLQLFQALGLVALAFIAGCKPSKRSQPQPLVPEGNTEWWELERVAKQKSIDTYVATNSKDFELFRDFANGKGGLPWVMFMVLPEIFPDIWQKDGINHNFLGLTPNPFKANRPVPMGLGFADDSYKFSGSPPPYQIANVSCGACHMGRVKGKDGKLIHLIGGTNTQFSFFGYLQNLKKTAQDSRFTLTSFKQAWDSHKDISFYGHPNAQQDIQTLLALGEDGTKKIQAGVVAGMVGFDFMSEHMYQPESGQETVRRKMSTMIGAFDAYGTGHAAGGLLALKNGAKKEQIKINSMHADIMAVWMQKDRPKAQWDSTIVDPLLRNLGAAAASVGDRTLLDVKLSERARVFLKDLPPAPYPFSLDKDLVDRGKVLAKKYCESCHYPGNDHISQLSEVGTDPNRALAFSPEFQTNLRKSLIASCTDKAYCQGFDESRASVVTRKAADLGYTTVPFHGIWSTAPYLHNGSVPTMYHLLVPSSRPKTFFRGNLEYDEEKMGYAWEQKGPDAVIYDTSLQGQSSAGHDSLRYLGINWAENPERLKELLAYLQSL